MIQLVFCPQKFPRTTTRREWKEIYRWKRLAQKELAKHNEIYTNFINDVVTYGTGVIRYDYFDNVINPPVVIPPKQFLK